MSKLFMDLWLRADTRVDNLQPHQIRQVRALCKRFFEKGRAYEKAKTVVPSTDNQLYSEEENDRRQS